MNISKSSFLYKLYNFYKTNQVTAPVCNKSANDLCSFIRTLLITTLYLISIVFVLACFLLPSDYLFIYFLKNSFLFCIFIFVFMSLSIAIVQGLTVIGDKVYSKITTNHNKPEKSTFKIILNYLKDRHQKVCTRITFTDDKE